MCKTNPQIPEHGMPCRRMAHMGVFMTVLASCNESVPSTVLPSGCPAGYAAVPGDAAFGTSDFCLMQYEAKLASGRPVSVPYGTPFNGLSATTAAAKCQEIDSWSHLVTNSEWMTVAANVASVAANWSGGRVGTGTLSRGHSDAVPAEALEAPDDLEDVCAGTTSADCDGADFSQRRALHLSNGQVIWDFAGNLWEWSTWDGNPNKPTPILEEWVEYTYPVVGAGTKVLPDPASHPAWSNRWTSFQGIGQYFAGVDAPVVAALRGGSWLAGERSGILALNLAYDTSEEVQQAGFRCAWSR